MNRTHKLEREFEATGPEMIALRVLFNHLMERLQALDEEEKMTDHAERVDRGISGMLATLTYDYHLKPSSGGRTALYEILSKEEDRQWQRFQEAEIARQDRAYIRRRISAEVDTLIEWPTKLRRVKIA